MLILEIDVTLYMGQGSGKIIEIFTFSKLNSQANTSTCVLCLQGIGDLTLAYQCFKLALAFNNDHAEAYNNLAVLELRRGRIEQVKN